LNLPKALPQNRNLFFQVPSSGKVAREVKETSRELVMTVKIGQPLGNGNKIESNQLWKEKKGWHFASWGR
jgi:hypothetical protein